MEDPYQRNMNGQYRTGHENPGFVSDDYRYKERGQQQFANQRLPQTPFGKYGFEIIPQFRMPPSASQPAVYEMDHLVTFDTGSSTGVMTHADGIRKLRQMEATSGVWTRRVIVSVDQREVVVTEKGTGNELESFPISLVSEPISYSEGKIPNVFNNIVMFFVDRESWTRQPSTLNIFECIGVAAQEVVDDIKAACAGRFPRPRPQADEVSRHSQQGDHIKRRSYEKQGNDDGSSVGQLSGIAISNRVIILNQCFDDIESFVIKLQKSARDLKQAKGDDRTSLPKRDFVDVLQKFKLSLNLAAELRNVLRSPSAPELVHSLFAPLELVVNVCRDQNGEPKLVENILSPLLTLEACRFLESHLNSDETRLWQSLGSAWTTARENWSGPAPSSYTPQFRNSRPMSRNDDLYSTAIKNSKTNSTHENGVNGTTMDTGLSNGNGADYVINIADQQSFLDHLKAKQSKVCVVVKSRESKDRRELTVHTDEFLEAIEYDKNWWRVRNSRNQVGYAPKTILRPYYGF